MPKKCYTPEKIINSLREAEVLLSQGNTTAQAAAPGHYRAGLLPLEERIRRDEDQPGQKAKGAGKGKCPA